MAAQVREPFGMANPGLAWLPEADVRSLATPAEPLSYLVNLRLAPGAEAGAFPDCCATLPNAGRP